MKFLCVSFFWFICCKKKTPTAPFTNQTRVLFIGRLKLAPVLSESTRAGEAMIDAAVNARVITARIECQEQRNGAGARETTINERKKNTSRRGLYESDAIYFSCPLLRRRAVISTNFHFYTGIYFLFWWRGAQIKHMYGGYNRRDRFGYY